MNYIGSKLSLLDFLNKSISSIVDDKSTTFCDLFAGTGAVGSYFKKKGYKIIANDIQYYSYVLNRHYIGNHKILEFKGLEKELKEIINIKIINRSVYVCNYLNSIDGVEGFIYKNYSYGGTRNSNIERLYFSDKNAKKCDAIRIKIEEWKNNKYINENEYYFLLATLLEKIDKSANTASVYGAFLKKLKKSAEKDMSFEPIELIENEQDHIVLNDDINNVIRKISADIIYLDPPYNARQYCSNYHMLETIAKYDNPEISGKTGLRDYKAQKSLYCSKNEVKNAFEDLIMNAKAKYIFLSYNNEGLMSLDDIKEIMSKRGKYGFFTKDYNRFKADTNREYLSDKTIEYLHYVIIDK